MEPCLRVYGGDVRSHVDVGRGHCTRGRQDSEIIGVPPLDHPEPAELTLGRVEVSVMVRVASGETISAYMVVPVDARDDLDRKGQPRGPRVSVPPIGQIERR